MENEDIYVRKQDVVNLAKSIINGSVYFGYPTLTEFIERVNRLKCVNDSYSPKRYALTNHMY